MHTHAARRTGTVRRSHPRHSRHISANPLPVSRAHTPQGPCAAPAVDTITPHTHGTDTISHAWYGDDAPRPLSTVHVAWYGDDAPRPFTTGHTPSRCSAHTLTLACSGATPVPLSVRYASLVRRGAPDGAARNPRGRHARARGSSSRSIRGRCVRRRRATRAHLQG